MSGMAYDMSRYPVCKADTVRKPVPPAQCMDEGCIKAVTGAYGADRLYRDDRDAFKLYIICFL